MGREGLLDVALGDRRAGDAERAVGECLGEERGEDDDVGGVDVGPYGPFGPAPVEERVQRLNPAEGAAGK
ncbi:hypothetical protein GCM10009801_50290 [Streptomyces albiaxialis]|uniref:Uncharacterized protein n=1 Tax=Streptomyces albiaxialis TaxID=329523 RepID=A0ABN2WBX6_9ACTN